MTKSPFIIVTEQWTAIVCAAVGLASDPRENCSTFEEDYCPSGWAPQSLTNLASGGRQNSEPILEQESRMKKLFQRKSRREKYPHRARLEGLGSRAADGAVGLSANAHSMCWHCCCRLVGFSADNVLQLRQSRMKILNANVFEFHEVFQTLNLRLQYLHHKHSNHDMPITVISSQQWSHDYWLLLPCWKHAVSQHSIH